MTAERGLSFRQIHIAATIYMALPLLCFFGGYLRWYYALVCCAALLVTLWCAVRKAGFEPEYKKPCAFSLKTIGLVFLFSMLWSYLGGMNGYWFQSSDWNCRNAIYFDLIRFDWPVIYSQNGGALVYYFGHWLPPALAAKVFQSLTGSAEAGLFAGRMLLWVWSSLGLTIIILLLFPVVGADTKKKRVAAVVLFAFFSGMDMIGMFKWGKSDWLLSPGVLHLEWWCGPYQYSSITTCLYWVFNQTIIPWMITLCFVTEDSPRNYVFYCVVCLLCGTLPCFGLVILMLVKAAVFCVKAAKDKQFGRIPRRIFSVQNLLSLLILFPVVATFILSNGVADTVAGNDEPIPAVESVSYVQLEEDTAPPRVGAAGKIAQFIVDSFHDIFSEDYIEHILCVFLILEVGAYMVCILPDHWKDPIFYTLAVSFFFIPYFHVGNANDFCMRASVPGIFILMLYVNRYLLAHFPTEEQKKNDGAKKDWLRNVSAVILALCFVFGTATPIVEIYRGFYHVVDSGTVCLENRSIMTFDREQIGGYFACKNPEEHFFFQYLAR